MSTPEETPHVSGETAGAQRPERAVQQNPRFVASNASWRVVRGAECTSLDVAAGVSGRGQLVWCDLPTTIEPDRAYKLEIEWAPRTTANWININLRDPDSGTFRMLGKVRVKPGDTSRRVDTVLFRSSGEDLTQLMFGATRFLGENAGATVWRISLEEVPLDSAPPLPPAPTRTKRMTFADRAAISGDHDHQRQVASFHESRTPESVTGARARLIFHAHAVEKGLSNAGFRPGFGKDAVPALATEMNSWIERGHDLQDPFFVSSVAVARSYFDRHAKIGHDVSSYREHFGDQAQQLIEKSGTREGGVIEASATREPPPRRGGRSKFVDVVYERRSVRDFTDKPVRSDDIQRAVQIAMQSPSVCNRQGARVHYFTDPETIRNVVDIQGGFRGYAMPPALLLVSCDLDAMLFPEERNQPFVDGGLFMMSLLLGLTHVGLGSCSLNTAMGPQRENAIRDIIDIPQSEAFISFVAVGHYRDKVLVARSKRTHLDDVLVHHEKG